MGLLRNLFGGAYTPASPKIPVVEEQPKRPNRPNPMAAGDMLIYHILIADKPFCVPTAEYDRLETELPQDIRSNFRTWATLYFGWRLRVLSRLQYGQEFQNAMTACAYAKLENSGIPETDVPIGEMRTAFKLLDNVLDIFMRDGAPVHNGIELPFAYLASVRLLTSTQGVNTDVEQMRGDLELATALATLDDLTADILPALLNASAQGTIEK